MGEHAYALVLCQDEGTQVEILGHEPGPHEDEPTFAADLAWVPAVLNHYVQQVPELAPGWGGVLLEALHDRGHREVWFAPADMARLLAANCPGVQVEKSGYAMQAGVRGWYLEKMALLVSRALPEGFISCGSCLLRLPPLNS